MKCLITFSLQSTYNIIVEQGWHQSHSSVYQKQEQTMVNSASDLLVPKSGTRLMRA